MATQAAEKQASELAKKLLELRSEYSKVKFFFFFFFFGFFLLFLGSIINLNL